MMYFDVMRTKYDQFGGRAGRRAFWLFMLVHFVLSIIAGVVDRLIFGELEWYQPGAISSIYWSISIVPVLAVGARRLHDTGRTGWLQTLVVFWIPTAIFGAFAGGFSEVGALSEAAAVGTLALVFFVAALVGTLILFIFAVMPGDEADNAYGMPDSAPERPAVYWTVLTTRYAMFTGRAKRKEYWLYILVSVMVGGVAGALDRWWFPGLLGDDSNGPIALVLFLATVIPWLAIGARRLHDTGRSGWWQLLLIPPVIIVGWIVILVFTVLPSQEGENKHGEPAIAPE